ncbi:hypothetical protein ACFQ3L_02525 [Lacticaseibacillus jixianensis]|uniref:Uncharacterized protein n=1 Tax=Lacticaseibacillus jixianensis TaxID=2486012 RepID=A0ABW4B6U3_9LACO|nr:hypothetical protein [Lacticaseibacillus jixianensis]
MIKIRFTNTEQLTPRELAIFEGGCEMSCFLCVYLFTEGTGTLCNPPRKEQGEDWVGFNVFFNEEPKEFQGKPDPDAVAKLAGQMAMKFESIVKCTLVDDVKILDSIGIDVHEDTM